MQTDFPCFSLFLTAVRWRRCEDEWTTERMTSPQADSRDQNSSRDVLDLNHDPTPEESDRYVRKIIPQKPIKMNVIHSVLDQAWTRFSVVKISETAPGILEFVFGKDEDIIKIIDMSPWAINGHILSIKRWDPYVGLNEVEFNKVTFWVQIHDLGYEKLSTSNARKVGNKIG